MVNRNEIRYVGVDGCPLGWFSVGFTQDGRWDHHACATFQGLRDHYADAEIILVDIPIGLPNGPEERKCDPQARALLNDNGAKRGSTVFRAPTRSAVEYLTRDLRYDNVIGVLQSELDEEIRPATDTDFRRRLVRAIQHEFAKAIHHQITGKWLTQQELGIMRKIAEVDACLPHGGDTRIREVHPEICFWALRGGKPIVSKKDTEEGRQERINVINCAGVQAQQIFDAARTKYPRKQVSLDDILDALAAAVTAYQGWPDNLDTLPEDPPLDGKCLPMEMVFWQPPPRNAD